jgi:myo-inositol-1(or 4)-monophosphatase
MHPMLNTAVKAARRAGNIISRATRNLDVVTVREKAANDFVSEVDREAERVIISTLHEAYPGHAILAEESGASGASEYRWVIDPLDGTTNFLHGFPQYCVSIALSHKDTITQGVIYDPVRNDLFTATRGRGAYVNDRRLRVSKRTQLKEALIATGFPFRPGDNFNVYLRMMAEVMKRTAGLRRPGAAALDLAYVAAGFTEGFFETGLSPWDVAAGSLLVTEAGGLIGNFTGEADFLEQRECVAGNPKVYGQLVNILKKYSKFASAGEKAELRQTTPTLVDPAMAPGTQIEDAPTAPDA